MTVNDYLREVGFELRDLPWRQRRDLLAELEGHLAELPAETNLYERLGSPEQYAADMRAAAGLERRRGPIAYLRARRPRNVILVALLLVVTSLAIGTVVWIKTYQPLATGNVSFRPNAIDSPTDDGIYYIFHQGRRFRYGLTIWNSGRFPVRVLEVPIDPWRPIRYRVLISGPMTFASGGGPPRPFTPFRPFDLAPGDERGIIFDGRFSEPCSRRSEGSEGWDGIPIRYHVLWHTSTVQIAFPRPLTFVFRKDAGAGCPATP